MNIKLLTAMISLVMLSACAGDKTVKVTSLQKNDKNLSCSEVMLEINEAEFHRQSAEKQKSPKMKNLLMPIGYISSYVAADDAIDAASNRVDYLSRIYEILDCDNAKKTYARKRGDNYRANSNIYAVNNGGGVYRAQNQHNRQPQYSYKEGAYTQRNYMPDRYGW